MNKHLKYGLSYILNREPTENEIFRIIISMDNDYPELGIFKAYSEEQIKKAKSIY